jgi:8-oxo-dGTP pyrophosphatase MutT (NUDIX family)
MIREFSAGGVVVCDKGGQPFVAVVRVRGETLALPKGHPFGDESAAEAARREVREETGLDAEVVDQLGDVKYWYVRGGKQDAKVVTFFLFRYRSGNVEDHDHEVEQARWVPATEALETLTYAGERDMVRRALSQVQRAK